MTQKVGVMRVMAGRSCGARDRVLRSFYTSAIHSSIDYAAPSLISLLPSAINPTAQNTALRTLRRTKCVSLRAEALVCRVEERVRQIRESHLATFLRHLEAALLSEKISLHQNPLLFQLPSWHSRAGQLGSVGLTRLIEVHPDVPVAAYVPPPHWYPRQFTLSLRKLQREKTLMSPQNLRR